MAFKEVQFQVGFAPWGHNCFALAFIDTAATGPQPLYYMSHGQGELGSTQASLSLLTSATGTLTYVLAQGKNINPATGVPYPGIYVAAQAPTTQGWSFVAAQLQYIYQQLTTVKTFTDLLTNTQFTLDIDTTKVHFSGYSSGGNATLTDGSDIPAFELLMTTLAPIGPAPITAAETTELMTNLKAHDVPMWFCVNQNDSQDFTAPTEALEAQVAALKLTYPPILSVIPGTAPEHNAWVEFYDPTWHGVGTESGGLNYMDWTRQYEIGSTGTVIPIPAPVTNPTTVTVTGAPVTKGGTVTITFENASGGVIGTLTGIVS
jgi:hypothetical protein